MERSKLAEKAQKTDAAVVRQYLKRNATYKSVGEARGVSGAAIRTRVIRFKASNPRDPLTKKLNEKPIRKGGRFSS